MRKILLLLICCFLLGCSSLSRSNTLESIKVEHEPEIEALPVAADLLVLEQKATGAASGKIVKRSELEMEALAKALGQSPPSAAQPDVLVGANKFTETKGDSFKVIITGYPAYYTNFRTVIEEEAPEAPEYCGEILNMVKPERRPVPSIIQGSLPETAKAEAQKSTSLHYFTLRYMLPVSEGVTKGNINIGGGWLWKSGVFFGFEFGLTPFSVFDDEWSIGGGMNLGGTYDLNDFQLFGGISTGFWLAEKREEILVASNWNSYNSSSSNYDEKYEDIYYDKVNLLGAFVGARWNIFELTYRIFPDVFGLSKGVYPIKGDGWHHQFMVGINL